jgi:hypothetical protein
MMVDENNMDGLCGNSIRKKKLSERKRIIIAASKSKHWTPIQYLSRFIVYAFK